MIILLFFAFLAGIVTVLSPCILPVLPALLAAGAGKGHLRPIGIIVGLIISFTFFTLTLTALVHLTGISPNILRYIAIALIAGFGLMMLLPKLSEKFAEVTSKVADLGQTVQGKSSLLGTGFWSGVVLGAALGLVWTPCAGPILAAITTLVATSAVSWNAFLITLVYSLGAAIPMFLIIYGGNIAINSSKSLSNYTEIIRKCFGALMILAALAIAFNFDVMFEQLALQYIPLINIEDNPLVRTELQRLRGSNSAFGATLRNNPPGSENELPKIAVAPDFEGITEWINSPPLSMQTLRGKVILVDFWTYSCINCIRTLPYIKDWYSKYKDLGFVVVGVHTPEFEFEKNPTNVKEAVKRFGILYPVAMDNNYGTWENYSNQYWPADYLVDQNGFLREYHFGEGDYMKTENSIRHLLGLSPLTAKEPVATHHPLTPETYLGTLRGHSYIDQNVIKPDQTASYNYQGALRLNEVGLKGEWEARSEKITARGEKSTLDLKFIAGKVFLVMDGDKLAKVTVLLDGKPLPKQYYTDDMGPQGEIKVHEPRKYDVIDLKGDYSLHTLTLEVPKGVSLYAFTFGD